MSPRHTSPRFARTWIDRLASSRDFTLSVVFHLILVLLLGSVVLHEMVEEPSDFITSEQKFVSDAPAAPRPPEERSQPDLPAILEPSPVAPGVVPDLVRPIPSIGGPSSLPLPGVNVPFPDVGPLAPKLPPATVAHNRPTKQQAHAIDGFVKDWVNGPTNVGTREQQFQFTAYVGVYAGGNWNSTNRVENEVVTHGSLPNLLYFLSATSKNKVKTNYRDVRAIRLDSDELFTVKPPFVFLTGTRDFRLTDREVENLRRYIQMGGAIWGDSSVPGRNSRFDIAFRREMKRILPDIDKEWEALPESHPIFSRAYFPEVRQVPGGLNHYREPVLALKIYDQVAVLYTANDYGDMWQVGLDAKGNIDLRRDERGRMVATNEELWNYRDTYVRNLSPEALQASYEFGSNVVIHLLTRWQGIRNSAEL